jgi:cellulose synthase/poly-beta-1,6-N-acetylglucosamine synthase-like glycosyltransferase
MNLLWITALLGYHGWQWQRDQHRLRALRDATPVPPVSHWANTPLVSVLVAAWNEGAGIETFVHYFDKLRYPHKELVLCAGGDDDTYIRAITYRSSHIQVMKQQAGEGKQDALARAFEYCRGEIIFLSDADCWLEDNVFERTLFPVVTGAYEGCTGSSRPTAEAWANPFIATQAASQLYPTLYLPVQATGILGRNCAIHRTALERSDALQVPAPTGTDYVLWQQLRQSGITVCQIPDSRILTQYPLTVRPYLRQQRRWLRNLVLHGYRFEAQQDVNRSLQTSLTGVALLVGLVVAVVRRGWLATLWQGLCLHMVLARCRYLSVTARLLKTPLTWRHVLFQPVMIGIDIVAWTLPLADYGFRHRRWEW